MLLVNICLVSFEERNLHCKGAILTCCDTAVSGVFAKCLTSDLQNPYFLKVCTGLLQTANLVYSFPLYKWFFFFGGLIAIWWIGEFIVRGSVYLIEAQFFNTKNVLYFLAAVRVSHKSN